MHLLAALTLTGALHAFFVDLKLQAALVVVFVDFVLGVLAAWKHGSFRLSYVAAFARDDIALKLLPWLAVYVGAKFAGHQQLVIPGVDLGVAATAIYVALNASWAGSILNSLTELGLPAVSVQTLRRAVVSDEHLHAGVTAEPPAPPS